MARWRLVTQQDLETYMRDTIETDGHLRIVYIGELGVGKTSLAWGSHFKVWRQVLPESTPDEEVWQTCSEHCTWTHTRFLDMLDEVAQGVRPVIPSLIVDDAGTDYSKLDWQRPEYKELRKAAQTFRKWVKIEHWTVPNIEEVLSFFGVSFNLIVQVFKEKWMDPHGNEQIIRRAFVQRSVGGRIKYKDPTKVYKKAELQSQIWNPDPLPQWVYEKYVEPMDRHFRAVVLHRAKEKMTTVKNVDHVIKSLTPDQAILVEGLARFFRRQGPRSRLASTTKIYRFLREDGYGEMDSHALKRGLLELEAKRILEYQARKVVPSYLGNKVFDRVKETIGRTSQQSP